MPLPVFTPYAQRVYDQLEPLWNMDKTAGYPLANFVATIATMYDDLDSYVRGTEDEPGWRILFDPDNIPASGLAWQAQMIGVQLDTGWTTQQKRDAIKARLGWQRGTPQAMRDAAALYLTGSKSVIFRERFPDAYSVAILVQTSETPDPAKAEAAVRAQKPAGIILTFTVLDGRDYQELFVTHATYQLVFTDYATYQELIEDI